MNRKLFITMQVILLTLVGSVLVVSANSASTDKEAQNATANAPVVIQGEGGRITTTNPLVPVDSGFTYQGRLIDGGVPANGTYSIAFTLYDAATGGNAVAGPITLGSVTVTDGLFTVVLDFDPGGYDANSFRGSARWLQLVVNGTTLTPRQPITAAPYAMSLMPGAVITGTADVTLEIKNDGGNIGLRANTNSGHTIEGRTINGTGMLGEASGFGHGVSGVGQKCAVCGYGTGGGPSVHGEPINGGSGYAGEFIGNVRVTGGCCSMSVGTTQIDHPLDPDDKYLSQAVVQSSDMLGLYNGNVKLDLRGEAWVQMPDWFEALNKDFRYQLTAIGAPGPNLHIAQKIQGNRFKIAGGTPGMEVSWEVSGVRHDRYAEQHPIKVESNKSDEERGQYQHPELYGQPDSKQVGRIAPPAPSTNSQQGGK